MAHLDLNLLNFMRHQLLQHAAGSQTEQETSHGELISLCDTYISVVCQRVAHHQQIRLDREVEMRVRERLLNSRLGLPEAIHRNYEEWSDYYFIIEQAFAVVHRQVQRVLLLRAEYNSINLVWQAFWDYVESGQEYSVGDGLRIMEIAEIYCYHSLRRQFLEDKFLDDEFLVSVLLEDEPEWIVVH